MFVDSGFSIYVLLAKVGQRCLGQGYFLRSTGTGDGVVFHVPRRRLVIRSHSNNSLGLFYRAFYKQVRGGVGSPILVPFVRRVRRLGRVSYVLKQTLLPSEFPPAIVVFSGSKRFLTMNIRAGHFGNYHVLLAMIASGMGPIVSPSQVQLLPITVTVRVMSRFIRASYLTRPRPPMRF